MHRLYEASDLFEAQLLKDLLERKGIQILIQGHYLQGGLGELPAIFPSLWVMQQEQLERAEQALQDYHAQKKEAAVAPPWQCHWCAEKVEAGFHQCWNCGTLRRD